MEIRNSFTSRSSFEVLLTTRRSQTASMTLEPGASSSEDFNAHPHSDQTLLLVEGELVAEIGEETARLRSGDSLIVPAGMMHRFRNEGTAVAVTFSVYAPPAYSAGT